MRVARFEKKKKNIKVEVFTQHDMGVQRRALLLQACHKTVQGGRAGIHQLPSVHARWNKSLPGRGGDSRCQRGNSDLDDKGVLW